MGFIYGTLYCIMSTPRVETRAENKNHPPGKEVDTVQKIAPPGTDRVTSPAHPPGQLVTSTLTPRGVPFNSSGAPPLDNNKKWPKKNAPGVSRVTDQKDPPGQGRG